MKGKLLAEIAEERQETEPVAMSIARMLKVVAGLTASIAVSACSSTGTVRQPTGPELVPSEKALVMPPPGGPAIVGVVEKVRSNGVEQTVSLATYSGVPGQNYLKVHFFGASNATPAAPGASIRTLSESGVRREIVSAAPGVRMARSTTFLQNNYGPFGYASGQSLNGDTCLFGWQQIRSSSTSGGIGRNFGLIQVRLRLCDKTAPVRQLLNVMYGYTITGSFDGSVWNPYGEPGGIDERLGKAGKPIYPQEALPAGGSFLGYGLAQDPGRNTVAIRRNVAARQPVQPKETTPAIIGPRVPAPDLPHAGSNTSAPGSTGPGQTPASAAAIVVPPPDARVQQP